MPVFAVIAIAIRLSSKGLAIFTQERAGKDGESFTFYKFRTMRTDVDPFGSSPKSRNDPRITKVGRFIRRFSIDELPQIINVLKCELSLVGPRPPIPKEVEEYGEWEIKRMNVKQGITGLWQVSGRSELSFDEMARLDLYYIQNWSIEMDIKILLKTIPTVLFGKGAY